MTSDQFLIILCCAVSFSVFMGIFFRRLRILVVLPFLLLFSFAFADKSFAAEVVDQSQVSTGNTLYFFNGWKLSGQRFSPLQNNTSRFCWGVGSSDCPSSIDYSLCKGIPNNSSQADVESSIMSCGWVGSSLISSGNASSSNTVYGGKRFISKSKRK